MSITALVVDDEPIARHAIMRLLRDDPDIELLGECGDGASAVLAIRKQNPPGVPHPVPRDGMRWSNIACAQPPPSSSPLSTVLVRASKPIP